VTGGCDGSGTWTQTQTQAVGCAKLYDVIYNHPGYLEWCDGAGTPCPGAGGPGYNLTADERFDLDRDGDFSDQPSGYVPPLTGERLDFSWQWYLVLGWDGEPVKTSFASWNAETTPDPVTITITQNTALKGAGVDADAHTAVDVDRDLKRERVMADTKAVDPTTGIITGFTVMDMQEGDLDFTRGDSDTGPEPGLQKDVKMYSSVKGGTYLLLEEGKLYDPHGQYIRTTQKKDQIDLIERSIQLSNDTGRFCDSGGNVVPNTGIWSGSLPNPVEACNDCFTSANVAKTCMVQNPAGDGTQPPVIYVRSRVVDRRGRKWVTNTSSDDYVDFTLPSGP
jgi:hypothetical protein